MSTLRCDSLNAREIIREWCRGRLMIACSHEVWEPGVGWLCARTMAAAVIAPVAARRATCTAVSEQECTMLRTPSSASEGSFWTTIELLADRGRRRSAGDADDYPTNVEIPSRRTSAIRCRSLCGLCMCTYSFSSLKIFVAI